MKGIQVHFRDVLTHLGQTTILTLVPQYSLSHSHSQHSPHFNFSNTRNSTSSLCSHNSLCFSSSSLHFNSHRHSNSNSRNSHSIFHPLKPQIQFKKKFYHSVFRLWRHLNSHSLLRRKKHLGKQPSQSTL